MLPIHIAKKLSVFNYDQIPAGYYHQVMLSGSSTQQFWHRKKFIEVADKLHGDEFVLDIGCGAGSFLSILADRFPNISAVGVDVASKQTEYARTNIQNKFASGKICFQDLDLNLSKLPFGAYTFDAITCIEVIEHIHPRLGLLLLEEAARVLKPSGKLIITTPNYRSFWPLIEIALEKLSPVKYHEQHINKYTPNSLVKFLESAGFDLVKLESIFIVSPFLTPISSSLANRMYNIEKKIPFHFGNLLMAELRKIGDLFS